MDVNDHQDTSTSSYGYDVVTPLAGDLVSDNRTVWQEVFMKKIADPPAFTLSETKVPNIRNCVRST